MADCPSCPPPANAINPHVYDAWGDMEWTNPDFYTGPMRTPGVSYCCNPPCCHTHNADLTHVVYGPAAPAPGSPGAIGPGAAGSCGCGCGCGGGGSDGGSNGGGSTSSASQTPGIYRQPSSAGHGAAAAAVAAQVRQITPFVAGLDPSKLGAAEVLNRASGNLMRQYAPPLADPMAPWPVITYNSLDTAPSGNGEFGPHFLMAYDRVVNVDGGQKVGHFGGQLRASNPVAGRGVRGTVAAPDAAFPFSSSAVGERCFQARIACTARRTSPD